LEAVALVGSAGNELEFAELLLHRGGPPHNALDHVVSAPAKRAEVIVSLSGGASFKCGLSLDGVHNAKHHDRARAEGLKETMKRVAVGLGRSRDGFTFGTFIDASGPRRDPADYLPTDGFVVCTYVDDQAGMATPTIEHGVVFVPFAIKLVDVQAVRERGTLEDAYTSLERVGRVKSVVQALSKSMKGLADLRILKSGEDFILHAIFDGQPPVPVYLTGDGSKRLVELASAILGVDPDGVVLLEEPECYQHPRYLRELASLLIESAKTNRQIILSTHSVELVDLLLEAGEAERLDYPFVHRLRLVDGKLSGVVLNREQAMATRKDLLEDLRA